MKKIIGAVVAAVIMATCSCFVSAAQPVIEGTNDVAVAVSDVAVTDTSAKVYVPVNVSFAESFGGIIGATVQFTFDTEKLSFDKNSSTLNFAKGGDTARININASNVITVQYISSDLETARKDGDVLATLAFDVVEDAYGDAEIEITSAKFAKVDNTAAANNTANGTVTIPKINNVEVAVSDVAVTDASAKVYVPVNVSFAESFGGIIGATVQFTFDTEKLSFDKNSSTLNFAKGGDTARININASNVITVQYISSDLETARKDGNVLATLAFDVVEGAYGEAEIEITSAKFAKVDNTAATNGTTNGTVTIPKPKYTVNFADDKNVSSASPVTEEIGTIIDLETLTGVAGYRFLGWSDDENTYTGTYTVTKDITLTAVWKTEYTPAIASGTTLTPEQQAVFVKYIEGETVTLPTLSDTESHTFTGWTASYTKDGAPFTTDTFTGSFTYPDAQVTFSAVFTEKPKHTVTFNMNGHGSAIEAVTDYEGKEITLPTPSKDGHFSFGGWENGNDTLQGGSQFVISETITLKAIWVEDEKFDVTFVSDHGTAPATVTGKYADDTVALVQLTDPNGVWKHTGWTDGTNNYDTTDTYTVVDGENTLTAIWVEYGAALATFTTDKGTKPEDIKKYNNDPEGTADTTIELPDITDNVVNWTFNGWQKNGEGEVLAAESSVVLEEGTTNFVANWTEDVPNAAIIETKVTYYTSTGSYLVDVYFYGADASSVAFGYKYGENLTFTGFTPAEGLEVPNESLTINEEGYFVTTVADTTDGVVEGADVAAGNGVHLGTITLSFGGAKEDYAEDDAADNVAITAPKAAVDLVCSTEYFLYAPDEMELEVERFPVVFDEAIEIEVIDVVYPVNGTVKVVREDGTAPRNFATIKAFNANGLLVKTFTVETATTTTTNGVFQYSIELPEGEYTLEIAKTGYLTEEIEVVVEAQEGAEEDGFEADPVVVDLVTLTPGDVSVNDDGEFGTIDLYDFVGITSAFDRGDLTDAQEIALDINEDGAITTSDLNYVRNYLIND